VIDLERHLRATYPDHERFERHPFLADAAAIVRQAYPELAAKIEFVFLRSRRRRYEQLPTENGGIIVVDEGLSTLSAFQDTVLGTSGYTPDHGLALALIPFAEAFKAERADDHALLCAAMIHEHRGVLRDLHVETARRPGRSALRHFLLLHEIAHFAVDTGAAFVASPLELVQGAIDALLAENRSVLERLRRLDDPLTGLDVSFPPGPSAERALMAEQTAAFIEQIAGSTQILREAGCDFAALQGFARLRLQSGLADGRPVSVRELGDVLITGLKGCRLLVADETISQTVQNIAAGSDASLLHASFSELQMRSNVLTGLAAALLEDLLTKHEFTALTEAEDPGAGLSPGKRFYQGVEWLHRRTVERILTPIEKIGMHHRDEELFASDLRAVQRHCWGDHVPTSELMEAAARDLIGRLPI
jgi:hypothetical protein